MAGRRYPEARFVREFTNAFGLTYREYVDSAGNRASVATNSIFGSRTPQQAAAEARRRLGRQRRERDRWRR